VSPLGRRAWPVSAPVVDGCCHARHCAQDIAISSRVIRSPKAGQSQIRQPAHGGSDAFASCWGHVRGRPRSSRGRPERPIACLMKSRCRFQDVGESRTNPGRHADSPIGPNNGLRDFIAAGGRNRMKTASRVRPGRQCAQDSWTEGMERCKLRRSPILPDAGPPPPDKSNRSAWDWDDRANRSMRPIAGVVT